MSVQITTDPEFKSFVYDARGYKDINAKIDADLATWLAAETPVVIGSIRTAVSQKFTVVSLTFSSSVQV